MSDPRPGGDAAREQPRNLPAAPSIEQLRKQAKDLSRAARAGDAEALARIDASGRKAREERVALSDAQLAIAREYGFASWPRLVRHIASTIGGTVLPALIRPRDLAPGRSWPLGDGGFASSDDVFATFVAARDGDLSALKRLTAATPALATVEYNYTPPIHFAVREGHRDVVEWLLERGADPAYRSYPFQESLLSFAEDRGHDDVAALLRRRLSQRFPLRSGTAAIIDAAKRGDLAAVEVELARDPALASASNETGDTPLHQAASGGHVAIVQTLLDAGASADVVRGDGYRPVHCALMPNWFFQVPGDARIRIAEMLLSRGARHTIFIAAMLGGDRDVSDALARDRSLVNFEDTCHHRVLSAAVRRGDAAMTRMLLEHGANPNLPEQGAPRGLSLWIAVNDRRRDIVEMLLARGADPNAEVESSGTPMLPAGRDPELLALLVRHGGHRPDVDRDGVEQLVKDGKLDEAERLLRAHPEWIDDNWGEGAIAGPARDGHHDVIAMLLRLGARVPTVSKWAPYYYFKHETTAAFLLENGMDPNHMNWHRFTLLHHMAAEGEIGKATLLLDHGADIDAIDDEYRSTPLGVAARRGQRELVALLLERGADPERAGAPWAMPLAWAYAKGHRQIAEMLAATA